MSRRLGFLTALCLSSVLACTMPYLLSSFLGMEQNRVDASLRPATTTTLSVWVTSDSMGDRTLLGALWADFEKTHPGIRIFSRFVEAEELYAADAVLPDVVLFGLGELLNPKDYLLALAQDCYDTGSSAGIQYGKPLWYAPSLLCIPSAYFSAEESPSLPRTTSFFDLATKAPDAGDSISGVTLLQADIPFDSMLSQNQLKVPVGVPLLQLMTIAPAPLQTVWLQTLQTSVPAPKEACAKVQTLASYLQALAKGDDSKAYVLTPPMNDQLRLIGLCKESEEGNAFFSYLQSEEALTKALSSGFLPTLPCAPSADPLICAVQSIYAQGAVFPNAFDTTTMEREALCKDALVRGLDPIETFLHLR